MFSRPSSWLVQLLTSFCILIVLTAPSFALKERVLTNFDGQADGSNPSAQLIQDSNGNFYGTASTGCQYGLGCVFKLTSRKGIWTETVLHSFNGADGSTPNAAVLLDSAGNVYGTTALGGDFSLGVAFVLTPSASGAYTEALLHSFGAGTDGYDPNSELVLDHSGNLYGTTQFGGTASTGMDNGGTVYRLSRVNKGWTETILYSFPGFFLGPDGDLPAGSVVIDQSGNLFGVTQAGGAFGKGTAYELARSSAGAYTESVIHSFNVTDGDLPNSTPVLNPSGQLYGTTSFGGNTSACPSNGCGVVFELRKNSSGAWIASVVHALNTQDGWQAVGPVAFDSKGNLYGAAEAGGPSSWGSVFKLIPHSQTFSWTSSVVHNFANNPDGSTPHSGVIVGRGDNLFGTTYSGGNNQLGVVFEIAP